MKPRIIILFLLFSAGIHAQQPEETILWNERPLTWQDFKAAPVPENGFHASANTGISYSWSAKIKGQQVELLYTVQAFFYPQFSWVREQSNRLLKHEQLHFDISELHARKLRKAMAEFDPQQQKDLQMSLRKIYENLEAERKAMQERYDRETRHSENVEAQQRWEKEIFLALQELEGFKAKD